MNEEKPFFDEKTYKLQEQVLKDFRQLKRSLSALGEHTEVDILEAKRALLFFNAAMLYVSDEIIKKTHNKHTVDDLLRGLQDKSDESKNQD